jgi:3-hydroxybutyryl-CoA dehydrogenase
MEMKKSIKGTINMQIKTVGVIGSGVMGSGAAQCLAQTGHQVILVDESNSALQKVKDNFGKQIRLYMMFSKQTLTKTADELLDQITFTTDPERLSPVDYILENVTEKWEIKEKIFTFLDQHCQKKCIFASNTSAIPIAQLAALTKRPSQIIGLHFMNPIPLKPTVEMIVSPQTSKETIAASEQLLSQMEKQWIRVNDSPGFVSNRVLMLTINEAIFLVQENVASPEDIDQVFKFCFSNKMGPLETADLIGLDTILLSLKVLVDQFQTDKFKPCSLLVEMVENGLLGRKTGQGFFKYPI